MALDYGSEAGGRVKGITLVKPIVYGNIARYFGKKREEDGHTHHWTIYIKPYRNEDMSAYVKKVQFKLHESYASPIRDFRKHTKDYSKERNETKHPISFFKDSVTKPPFELTETGWGEFEIIIKIFFVDPNERPVTLYHFLKLFQTETNLMLGKKTLVSEHYDEMIFQDPTVMMQQLLVNTRPLTLGTYKHETDFTDLAEKTVSTLQSARKKIRLEIQELNERLKQSKEVISHFKEEIQKLEDPDGVKEKDA